MYLRNEPRLNLQLNRKLCQEEEYLDFYQKGEIISLKNSGFYQVYRGVVQLNRLNHREQEVVIGWVTPNHAFGNLINGDSGYYAIALTDVYLRSYKPVEVVRNSQLSRQLLSELSYRLVKSEQMIDIISRKKVEERLLGLLSMLKEEMGHPVNEGIRLTARFTHQSIANTLCTTRVTITRIFGDLEERNLLEFDKNRHLIIKF